MKRNPRKTNENNKADINQVFGKFDFDRPLKQPQGRRGQYEYIPQNSGSKQNHTRSEMRKRQNKKRRLKLGVRNTLITFAIIIAFAAIGIALSLTVFFNITNISVSGSGIYSEDEVIRMCGIDIGENLFLIDTEDSAKRLQETLPYIYDVKIKRELPVTLSIEITDAVPKFSIQQEDESYILLDDRLKVLEVSADNSQSTVLITQAMVISSTPGLQIQFENDKAAGCITALSEAINAVDMTEATALSSIDTDNNYIVYEGRITFALGDCSNLESKLYRGLAACEELDASNANIKGTLDLSYEKESYFTAE